MAEKAESCGSSVLQETAQCFRRPQHAKFLLANMNELRARPHMCDVTLMVGGKEFYLQKIVLSAASTYFRALFDYSKGQGQVGDKPLQIEAESLTASVFEQIVEYIYTGKIDISEDNVQDILQAADILLMTDLKDLCCEFLEQVISPENCLGIRNFAELFNCPEIHFFATEYMEMSFHQVMFTEEFLELTFEQLLEILEHDKLNVRNEQDIVECVLKWLEHQPESRVEHLQQLLSSLWLETLEARYIEERIAKHELVIDIGPVQTMLLEHMQPKSEEQSWNSTRPRGYMDVIVAIGGESRRNKDKVLDNVRCVRPAPHRQHMSVWIDLAPLLTARKDHAVCAAGGYIFVYGGIAQDGQVLYSGERYDPGRNEWKEVAPMREARHSFGLVAIGCTLYAIGGEGDFGQVLETMERYDIFSDKWTPDVNMTAPRKLACYATCNKKIYAIGGGRVGKLYESVECYNPKTQLWSSVSPLEERRFHACATGTLGNELYVVGGFRKLECPSSVHQEIKFCGGEVYSEAAGRWFKVSTNTMCTMTGSSIVNSAVTIGSSVYVVGDLDVGHQYNSIREFRIPTQTWHCVMRDFPSDQKNMHCCTIRMPSCFLFRAELEKRKAAIEARARQIYTHAATQRSPERYGSGGMTGAMGAMARGEDGEGGEGGEGGEQ
ncbi:gigaxonin-like [Branchiostoma floridae]|uniref:Gigaxonin-like n=1 Tax=Branchiostoma floridae TaxID=7739 RepID=A0A9J7MU12_BRAFL|nr:gigaxonin-like [Branchiostoma floridae]